MEAYLTVKEALSVVGMVILLTTRDPGSHALVSSSSSWGLRSSLVSGITQYFSDQKWKKAQEQAMLPSSKDIIWSYTSMCNQLTKT